MINFIYKQMTKYSTCVTQKEPSSPDSCLQTSTYVREWISHISGNMLLDPTAQKTSDRRMFVLQFPCVLSNSLWSHISWLIVILYILGLCEVTCHCSKFSCSSKSLV
jgi:hypothetical protein